MKILITRWGILKFNPILNYYINWDFIASAIQNETYMISIWFFKNLPKMFKDAYVIYLPGDKKQHQNKIPRRIETTKDIELLLSKLEDKEEIEIPQDKKQEIIDAATVSFQIEENQEIFKEFEL